VIPWTAVCATVLIGFVALAVDGGYLKVVKAQIQNAADSAAMAGVSALIDPRGLVGSATPEDLAQEASLRSMDYASKNFAEKHLVLLDASDITVGHISNPKDLGEPVHQGTTPYNAVAVRVRKTEGSPNGAVGLFFGVIFGKETASLSTQATAYLDSGMYAYKPLSEVRGPAIPVTVWKPKWIDEIVNAMGDDNYGYDPVTDQITLGPDGIPEISIYPQKQGKIVGEPDGAGNFGLLHIGTPNQGTPEVGEQIRTGFTPEQVETAFGEPQIRFYNDAGSPITHILDGTPGVKNSLIQLEDDFHSRLNTVVGFFVHESIIESGANIKYGVTGMQFGRIMALNAHGSLTDKAVVIQPVGYLGREVIVGEGYTHHDTGGRIRLVR
jgi:hypothetical protein